MTAERGSRADLILLGNILPFALGSIFFSGKVASRAYILRTWGWDDWYLALGWVAALANCIMACLGTRYGSGTHMDTVSLSMLKPGLQLSYGTLIAAQLSQYLTKLSICVLYLRVFTTSRGSRYFLFGVIGFVVASAIGLECVCIFQCTPIRGVWDTQIDAKCINTIGAFYANTVVNIVVDIVLMVFAIPRILGLNMAPRQKYALVATVLLGAIPVIASIIRAVRTSTILHATDKTWVSYDSSIWSAVDANVSIICASAPGLKPVLRKLAPGIMGSTFGTSQPATSGQYYSNKKSWLRSARDTTKGYELHSAPRHTDVHNGSQTELAKSVGRTEWTMTTKNTENDDVVSEGSSLHGDDNILKSVTVAVTSMSSSSS